MKGKAILNRFGFNVKDEPVSIYPYSPVYHVKDDDYDIVIKRTQRPMIKAQNLIRYTTYLKENGISIVTPVSIRPPNPQTFGDQVYIVYPYIQGSSYVGDDQQIVESGRLLGQIHALSPKTNLYQLPRYEEFDFTVDEVKEAVEKIVDHATQSGMFFDRKKLQEKLIQAVQQQGAFKRSGILFVASPYDYKANNLVFTPDPYIIDPDNATWVPKLFDLALVLLLFHNEMGTAPARIFTKREWGIFLKGYQEFTRFTEQEKMLWPSAIYHVFLDEVMWLMAENPDDWNNPSQRELFKSLLKLIGVT